MLLPAVLNRRSGCSFVALLSNNEERNFKSSVFKLSLILRTMLSFTCLPLLKSLPITKPVFLNKMKVTAFSQCLKMKQKGKRSSLMMLNSLDAPQKRFRTVELSKDPTTNPQLLSLRNASIERIFGALAEDKVLIDVSQGKCCFSGCPGCDFYNDDGTYQYEKFKAYLDDSLTHSKNDSHLASLAAWIPAYSFRSVGGTEKHVAKWTRVLFPTVSDKFLCKDVFCQRLLDAIECLSSSSRPVIECEDAMLRPAKSFSVHVTDVALLKDPSIFFQNVVIQNSTKMVKKFENSKYDKEAVEAFWMLLSVLGSSLTKRQMEDRLKKWNEVSNNSIEGIGFANFSRKMLEAISLRYGEV